MLKDISKMEQRYDAVTMVMANQVRTNHARVYLLGLFRDQLPESARGNEWRRWSSSDNLPRFSRRAASSWDLRRSRSSPRGIASRRSHNATSK